MSIVRYIQLGALAVALLALGYLMWQNHSRGQKIETLKAEKELVQTQLDEALSINESNVRLHQIELEGAKEAKRVAEEALARSQARDTELRRVVNDLKSIPLDQRSSVSGTVCGTIDRLYPSEDRAACPY